MVLQTNWKTENQNSFLIIFCFPLFIHYYWFAPQRDNALLLHLAYEEPSRKLGSTAQYLILATENGIKWLRPSSPVRRPCGRGLAARTSEKQKHKKNQPVEAYLESVCLSKLVVDLFRQIERQINFLPSNARPGISWLPFRNGLGCYQFWNDCDACRRWRRWVAQYSYPWISF